MDIDTRHDSIDQHSYPQSLIQAHSSQKQPNIYKPLPSHLGRVIRLIAVSLPLPDPPLLSLLTAHLEVHPLDSAPSYNAISYVWGSSGYHRSVLFPGGSAAIRCNDALFPVTPNLHWALHRAALFSDNIYLWADGVCINQSDLSERSSQVSFMGDIYARAERVLVCMGEPPATSPPGSNLAVSCLTNTLGPLINANPGTQISTQVLNTIPPLAWQALSDILKCPWFQRVWVMQEVGMAREQPVVLYGFPGPSTYRDPSVSQIERIAPEYEFGYRDLMAVVEWAKRRKELVIRYGIGSLRIHGEWAGSWGHHQQIRMTFYDLIDHACLLSCQDQRDRIYAFLGHPLAPRYPDGSPKIKPDYTKPVNELYLQVSKICLEEIVGLRALITVEHTPQSLQDGFPSWMTRWHITGIWNNISRLPEQIFSAGGLDEPGYKPIIDGNALYLEGVLVDKLWRCFTVYSPLPDSSVAGPSFSDPSSDDSARVDLEQLLMFLTASGNHGIPPCACGSDANTRLMAFAMTICAAGSGETDDGAVYLEGLLRLVAIDRFLRTNARSGLNAASDEAVGGVAFWRELSSACTGRSFAVTERGRYCLVPQIARPGDQICVVRRLDVPVLMRVEATRRALLGEAYVCGLMHGEALGVVQRGELAAEVFAVT
ncbi:heterokaryon incompatibility protein-domain-containing protein [Rhypophila decipiens]|uniref:Heterokaryon incompatibility protein-domain-containing protein n=1 Tax=Rhypophila decipiens TaxID=261697 RepID=A0AAN7B4M5_9PEZI|nr:heterokaryon incompatibility protein-domain-containing protein [Rhypophila decipiens]